MVINHILREGEDTTKEQLISIRHVHTSCPEFAFGGRTTRAKDSQASQFRRFEVGTCWLIGQDKRAGGDRQGEAASWHVLTRLLF